MTEILNHICCLFLVILAFAKCISGENIVRHDCNTQATFYKVASNYAMLDTANTTNTTNDGYMGCVDLCIEYPFCKAFNFKAVSKDDGICELLHKDRTTNPNDVISRSGWSYYDTGLFTSQVSKGCFTPIYHSPNYVDCFDNMGCRNDANAKGTKHHS